MNSLVSIIMPSYNSGKFISASIESVLNQTYTDWELIIVDDCSTDNTFEIVNSFQLNNSRIQFHQNPTNSGPAISRNRAIEVSKGRYIAFLDSDDLWYPNKLEEQIEFMQSNQYPFSYSYYTQIDEENNFLKNIDNLIDKVSYNSLMKQNIIGCLTAIYDTDFFGKVYMENISKRQDYALWLNLLKKSKLAYCYPTITASYRIRSNSVSSNKFRLIKFHWIIYRRIERKSFIKSSYYVINYILTKIFVK